uniref:Glycosyltransferase n=1 Tax=Phenylobacterium glaciei TaxID=2803784 RepID=A0A974P3S7_9CAUL|nr:glycosyltransferase [Phenylobacterium glaciei]
MPRASIVIPAYNNLKFTLECLASLQAAGGVEDAEIIVIDDASADATSAVLATVPGLTLLTNPRTSASSVPATGRRKPPRASSSSS